LYLGECVGESLSHKGLFHLCVIYTVWSTTYLAMRVGVAPANGFPPFAFGALRMAAAASILLVMARLQGVRTMPARAEIVPLMVAGNLFWCGGHGLVLWAAQYVPSGFSCLMVSSAPVWATLIELCLYKKRPSAALVASLLVGFAGVAVLSAPSLGSRGSTDFFAVVALVVSPLCWVLGSVFQARRPVILAPQVLSGYHHLAALFGFLIASLALGEPAPHPSLSAWTAWGYLVIFGSVGAFTSYVLALRLLPINIVMTYAYVNPVLALFLGWLLLDEPITVRTLVGAGLVVVSVFAIFHFRQQTKARAPQSEAESVPVDVV
jgi:drug/metabolite transporter (DMT)-like permease